MAVVGRKKETDKKIPVQFYVKSSIVKKLGGIERARTLCQTYAETHPKVTGVKTS